MTCRTKMIAFLVASVGAMGQGGCAKGRARELDPAAKPLPARVVSVESKQIRRTVESVGTLFPYDEVTVSSEVEGKVERVFVDVGDHVFAGSPLLQVSPTELALAADQERAALEQVRARLGLREGDELKNVDESADVRRAAAELEDAEQKYQRAKSLFEDGLIARGAFDEAESHQKGARAAHDLARQNVETLRAQLSQRGASMAVARKKVDDALIRAPFAGHVKERTVAPGQYLKVQTPVMVIVNNDPLRVRLKVPERMAAWISVGQAVSVAVEAFPGQSFEGKVSRISPAVDPQTRSFEVEALLSNREGLLKPGFFARARVATSHVETALLIPHEALLYRYGVYKVFTVQQRLLTEKEVKLGDRDDGHAEIVLGLTAGEQVAVPVKGELRDGAPVEAVQ